MADKTKVSLTILDGDCPLGLILIDNPPVNAMSIGIPCGIVQAMHEVNSHPAIMGALLVGGGSGVLAGADIKMQGKVWPTDEPNLLSVINVLEASSKPVAILLQRAALGGGLEIAMSCDVRFATEGTQIGQPEVKLGIPPGAGGTQRLPRLVGVPTALELILSGQFISAQRGREIGLIDGILSGEAPIDHVASHLRAMIKFDRVPPKVSARETPSVERGFFDQARIVARKKYRGQQAPLICIDCIEKATTAPFDVGLAFERQKYFECVKSPEAAALRHVFFAERQNGKVAGIEKKQSVRPTSSAAVIGAGTMGVGIAICFADSGISVTLIEQDRAVLHRGLGRITDHYSEQVRKGRLDDEVAAKRILLIEGALKLDAASDADVIIEAVFENMEVKKSIFSQLSKIAKQGAVLSTNTSYLDVNVIAAATNGREMDVLGLHFFNPANVMKLLEVVRGTKTADDTLMRGVELGKTLGKTAVVSGVGYGFIGNRMFTQYSREAEFLLQEGATVDQIDNTLHDFGMAMGPFLVRDLAGLDIGWAMRKSTAHLRKPGERYSSVCDEICAQGWLGQKTRRGFYVYDDNQKSVNPKLQSIVDETGKAAGVKPGDVKNSDIVERCVYALINEGAKILEDRIAMRASDIDLVFINGYGFPRWRGGPMHYADTVGLGAVLEAINRFHESHDFWAPAALLERLAKKGETFASWDEENANNEP